MKAYMVMANSKKNSVNQWQCTGCTEAESKKSEPEEVVESPEHSQKAKVQPILGQVVEKSNKQLSNDMKQHIY